MDETPAHLGGRQNLWRKLDLEGYLLCVCTYVFHIIIRKYVYVYVHTQISSTYLRTYDIVRTYVCVYVCTCIHKVLCMGLTES